MEPPTDVEVPVAPVVDTAPSTSAVPHLERDNERLRAPADVRELVARRRLASAAPLRMAVHLAVVAVVYFTAMAVGLAVDTWWAWIVVWALQAFLLLSCGAVMHEGIHGNVTGHRRIDRVLAFLAGWLIFLPAAGYRPYHLQHHATNMSAEDPSGANAKPFKHRREYLLVMLLAGPGFTAQMWSISLRTLFGRAPAYVSARHRRQIVRETAISLVLYGAVAVAAPMLGLGHVVLFGWVIPAVIGLCAVAPYILMPEHYGAPQDRTIVESTATVRSNPLLSFVYLNNNHHTAHHLMSSCNPLHLDEITDLLGDRVDLQYRSYGSFHREVFRSLGW